MSLLCKQALILLILQFIACKEHKEVPTAAPESCLMGDQTSPHVMISPTKPQVVEHGSIDLKCTAPNTLKPNFRWFKNGNATELPTTLKDIASTITESILTIKPSREDNGTEFYCSVWSEIQRKEFNTCYVTLDVQCSWIICFYPPKIFMKTYPEVLTIGAPGRIDCFVDANPAPSYMILTGNEANLTDFVYDKETKMYRISVNFSTFSQRDSGYYTCASYNGLNGLVKENLSVEARQSQSSISNTIGYTFAGIGSFIVVAIIVLVLIRFYRRRQLPTENTISEMNNAKKEEGEWKYSSGNGFRTIESIDANSPYNEGYRVKSIKEPQYSVV